MGKLKSKLALSIYAIFAFLLGLFCVGGNYTSAFSNTKEEITVEAAEGEISTYASTSYPIGLNVGEFDPSTLPYANWYDAFTFYDNGAIDVVKPNIEVVYIPRTVESINTHTFRDNTTIKYVYIQGGRTSKLHIPYNAFEECANLQYVQLENTLETALEQSTFKKCTNLKYVNCSNIESFADRCFQNCTNLLSIGTPKRLRYIDKNNPGIGVSTFEKCNNLNSIIDISNFTEVPTKAFKDCYKLSRVDSNVIYTIRKQSFENCRKLTELNVDSSATFEEYCFNGCSELVQLAPYIEPNSLGIASFKDCYKLDARFDLSETRVIPDECFRGCSKITVSNSDLVTTVGAYAFDDCRNIDSTGFYFSYVSSIGNYAFRNTSITNVQQEFSDFTTLGAGAFANTKLQYVNLNNLEKVPSSLFQDCKQLTTVWRNVGHLKTIGSDAFNGCSALTSFEYSLEGVTNVGSNAFYGAGLTSVSIPNLTVIESGCFRASKLVIVSNTSRLTEIKDNAFLNCGQLESIDDTPNLTELGEASFDGCNKLQSINLSKVSSIPVKCFRDCWALESVGNTANLTTLKKRYIDPTPNNIASGATKDNNKGYNLQRCYKLQSINLSQVREIPIWAFDGCKSLTSVGNTQNLTTIHESAFSGCTSLQNINLSNVTAVPRKAFYDCTSLSDLGDTSLIQSIGTQAFNFCESLTNINLQNIRTIGNPDNIEEGGSFKGCTNLRTIGNTPNLTYVAKTSFADCPLFTTIDLSHVTQLGDFAFENSGLIEANISSLTYLTSNAFKDALALTTVTLSNGLTEIPNYAFSTNSNLATINLNNVTIIGERAFSGTKLTQANLSSVVEIHKGAFYNCQELTYLYSAPQLALLEGGLEEGDGAFENCSKLFIHELFSGNTVLKEIGASTFYYSGTNVDAWSLVAIQIPTSVKVIKEYAFACTGWRYYDFYDNGNNVSQLTTIESNAFSESSVAGIDIDNCPNLEYIGENAFSDCKNLWYFAIINENVEIEFGNDVFSGCSGLESFQYVPGTVKYIPQNMFATCSKLKYVGPWIGLDAIGLIEYAGQCNLVGIEDIAANAFNGTPLLTHIYIPDTVESIGRMAFRNNPNIESFILDSDGIDLGVRIFSGSKVKYFEVTSNVNTVITGTGTVFAGTVENAIIRGSKATGERNELFMWNDLYSTVYHTYLPREDYAEYIEQPIFQILMSEYYQEDYTISYYPIIINYIANGGEEVEDTYIEQPWMGLQEVSHPIPTRDGYTFAYWYNDPLDRSTFEFYVDYTLPEYAVDRTAYAAWVRTEETVDWRTVFTYTISDGKATITGFKDDYQSFEEVILPYAVLAEDGSNTEYPIVAIGDYALFSWLSITKVDLSNATQLKRVGDNAFFNNNITELNLGTSVESIGAAAFTPNSLTELTIPASLTDIYNDDFSSLITSPDFRSVTIDSNNPKYAVIDNIYITSKDGTILYYVAQSMNYLLIPDGVTSLHDNALNVTQNTLKILDTNELPTIPSGVFRYTKGLTQITVGANTTSIEMTTFINADKLLAVTINGEVGKERTSIPTLGLFAFDPDLEGKLTVYVPMADLESYQADSSWSVYNLIGYGEDVGVKFYTITIDNNGGTGIEGIVVPKDGIATLTIAPTREGYTLAGWKVIVEDDVTLEIPRDFEWDTTVEHNMTVRAEWTVDTYHILFTLNGGISAEESVEDVVDFTYTIEDFGSDRLDTIELLETTKIGYEFIGWYDSEDFQGNVYTEIKYNDYRIAQITGRPIQLYARWQRITFTMVVPDADDDGFKVAYPEGYGNPTPYGDTFRFIVVFEEGYTQNTSENIIVTAKRNGVEANILTVKVENGVEFYEIPNVTTTYTISIDGVEKNRYNVYFRAGINSDTITNMQNTIVVEHGSNVNAVLNGEALHTPLADGYKFASWNLVRIVEGNEDISTLAYNFNTDIYEDTIITAIWTLTPYTITYKLNGGQVAGDVTSDIKVSYTIEDTVILPTYNSYGLNRRGYTFLGWVEVIDGINGTEYVESIARGTTGNKTFRAMWEVITYTISYNLNNGTLAEKYPTTFTVNDEVTLPLATRLGHTFLGWSEGRENANYIITTIEEGTVGNYILYANWQVNSYNIEYNLGGDSIAPVSVNNVIYNDNLYTTTYEYSDEESYLLLTSSQLYREGFTFGGWYDNPEFAGDKYTTIFATVTGDKTFYAKWNATEYTFILVGNGGQVNGLDRMTFTFSYQDLVDNEGRIVLPTEPDVTREGDYHFIGWYDSTGKLWDVIRPLYLDGVDVFEPFILGARWSEARYTLTTTGVNIDKVNLVSAIDESDEIGDESEGAGTIVYGGTLKFLIHFNDARYSNSKMTVRYTMGTAENVIITPDEYGYYIIENIDGDITIDIEGITINTYTIAFHEMGGSTVAGITDIEYGQVAHRPDDPTKEGYTFAGWYLDPEYTTLYNWDDVVVENITLYAKWDTITYTVTIANNVNDNTTTTTYDVDHVKIFNAPSAINGYVFDGYYLDDTKVTSTEGMLGNVTIVAKYNLVTYNITYATFGGNDGNNPKTYTIVSEDITLNDASKSGYNFLGWYKVGTEERVTTIAKGSFGDINLEARFSLVLDDYYSVTYVWERQDTNTIERIAELAVLKDNVLGESLYAALEEKGYTFEGWYGSSTFDGEPYTAESMITADTKLYAKMTPIEYSITYVSPIHITLPTTTTYTILDDIELEDLEIAGYAFLGWYTDVVVEGETYDWTHATRVRSFHGETGDKVFYARFNIYTYTITYILDGGIASNPDTYTVESETIILSDASKEGYIFDGWYNGNEKVESIEKGSYGNLTLTARYTLDTYTISYSNDLGLAMTATNPTTYTINDIIVLNHDNYDGYTFEGWYLDSEKVDVISGMTGDITLVARYSLNTYHINYYVSDGTHSNPTTYTVESDTITLTPATKENYSFLYWTTFDGNQVTTIEQGSTGDITLIAVYELIVIDRFEVNYYDGDTLVYQDSVASGEKLTKFPDNLTKTGYVFVDFYLDREFSVVFDRTQDITENKTVYLRYDLVSYTITYESKLSGMTHTNARTYTVENIVTFAKPNNISGYTFVGWTLNDEYVTSTQGLTGDITLIAVFALNEYRITYVLNGGTSNNPSTYTVEDRDIILQPATKEGYVFVHFEDENGVIYTTIRTDRATDLVLVAIYELDEIEYTEVTYYAFGQIFREEAVEKGSKLTNYSPNEVTGYTFAGWYINDTMTTLWNFDQTVTDSRITLYARYDAIVYNIMYIGVEDDSLPTSYSVNNLVMFPDTLEKEGYTFIGFYYGNTRVFNTYGLAEDLVIEARFALVRYTIHYDRNGGMHANPATYTILDDITLLDATKVGYTFTGWTDEEGNVVTKIAQGTTGEITLTANFVINNYTIGYIFVGIGEQKPENYNPTTATYEDRITLSSLTLKGYTFVGWFLEGQQVTSLEHIASDIVLEGRWEKEVYTITLLTEQGQPQNMEYTISDRVELPEQSKKGYTFKGWRDVVTGQIYTTIDGSIARNITLFIEWEPVEQAKQQSNINVVIITVIVVLGAIALVYGGAKYTSRVKQKKRRQQKAKDLIASLDRLKEEKKEHKDNGNNNNVNNDVTGTNNTDNHSDEDK